MSGRIAIVAALLAAAGCYQPSVEACRYLCNNQQCPSGLECNAQGMCAESTTAMCSALPNDAPSEGGPSEVTVVVQFAAAQPEQGVLVVFADRTGALVAEKMTDANGTATADIGVGGSATVIRSVPVGTTMQPWATTYLDLPQDARVVCQQQPHLLDRSVLVRWTAPGGVQGPSLVTASCMAQPRIAPAGSTEFTIPVPVQCLPFDVIVTLLDPNNVPVQAAVMPAQSTPQVDVPLSAWMPVVTIPTTISRFPTNATRMTAGLSGRVTPTLPDTAVFMSSTLAIDGSLSSSWRAPTGIGLTAQLAFTQSAAFLDAMLYRERLPATTTAYTRNLDGRLLPWMQQPTTAGTTVSWSTSMPLGTTPATPDLMFVNLAHQDPQSPNDSTARWHIVAPAARITASGTTAAFVLPDVPGDRAFELTPARSVVANDVFVFDVDDAAINGVRGLLGAIGYDLFRVPELTHITVSRAQ